MASSTNNPQGQNLAAVLLIKRKMAGKNENQSRIQQAPDAAGAHSNERINYRQGVPGINPQETATSTTSFNTTEQPKISRKTKQLEVNLLDQKMEEINRKQETQKTQAMDTWKGFDSLNYGFNTEPERKKSTPVPPVSKKPRTPTSSPPPTPKKQPSPVKTVTEPPRQESPVKQQSAKKHRSPTPKRVDSPVKEQPRIKSPPKEEEPRKETPPPQKPIQKEPTPPPSPKQKPVEKRRSPSPPPQKTIEKQPTPPPSPKQKPVEKRRSPSPPPRQKSIEKQPSPPPSRKKSIEKQPSPPPRRKPIEKQPSPPPPRRSRIHSPLSVEKAKSPEQELSKSEPITPITEKKISFPSIIFNPQISEKNVQRFERPPAPIATSPHFKHFPDIKHYEIKKPRNAHKSIQRSMDRYRFHVW